MSTDQSKGTGRTLWDFLITLSENRRTLYWANALAWLIIVGVVAAISAGYIRIDLRGSSASGGAPWSLWAIESVVLNAPECDALALEALTSVKATNISGKIKRTDEMYRTGAIGSTLAWIVCVQQHGGTLFYVGASGDDYDIARDLVDRLAMPFDPHLVKN